MTLKLLLLFFISFQTIFGHHIVFEQIGELASSVTYMHVKLTVELSSIETQAIAFRAKLQELFHKFNNLEVWDWTRGKEHAKIKGDAVEIRTQIMRNHVDAGRKIIDYKILSTKNLEAEVKQLKNSMPIPRDEDRMIVQRSVEEIRNTSLPWLSEAKVKYEINPKFQNNPVLKDAVSGRNPRFLNPMGLALGAFGTFMGLFNHLQIKNLREEVAQKHGLLLEVVTNQQKQLTQINQTMDVVIEYITSAGFYDVTIFLAELNEIENEIRRRINWAAHAIQAAQNHRMAIDLITDEKLKLLYFRLKLHSKDMGLELLTSQASDLYQLETSYFFDGNNMHLLLHVPLVNKANILRLLRLHPFPLYLNQNFTMTPDVSAADILAIAPGFDRYSTILSAVDLFGCHSVNKVFLCDRHGVLSKELNNTCLGALYLQDFTIAKEICDFKINPTQEVVQQLLNNWFLIFSPTMRTGFIQCINGTQRETYLQPGINKIHLSPGCNAALAEHQLHADGAITITTDITHFEWSWDVATELHMDPKSLNLFISELQDAGIISPSLNDLSHLKIKTHGKWNYLWYFLSFIFSSVAIGIIAIVIFSYVTHKTIIDFHKIIAFFRPKPKLIEPIEDHQSNINYPPLLDRPPANAPLYNLN